MVRAAQRVQQLVLVFLAGTLPGQAAVFYDGDTVLGGGWIK